MFLAIERITGVTTVCRDFRVQAVTVGKDAQAEVNVELEYARPAASRPRRFDRQPGSQRQGVLERDQSHHGPPGRRRSSRRTERRLRSKHESNRGLGCSTVSAKRAPGRRSMRPRARLWIRVGAITPRTPANRKSSRSPPCRACRSPPACRTGGARRCAAAGAGGLGNCRSARKMTAVHNSAVLTAKQRCTAKRD